MLKNKILNRIFFMHTILLLEPTVQSKLNSRTPVFVTFREQSWPNENFSLLKLLDHHY
jgi:hypothetical protein